MIIIIRNEGLGYNYSIYGHIILLNMLYIVILVMTHFIGGALFINATYELYLINAK